MMMMMRQRESSCCLVTCYAPIPGKPGLYRQRSRLLNVSKMAAEDNNDTTTTHYTHAYIRHLAQVVKQRLPDRNDVTLVMLGEDVTHDWLTRCHRTVDTLSPSDWAPSRDKTGVEIVDGFALDDDQEVMDLDKLFADKEAIYVCIDYDGTLHFSEAFPQRLASGYLSDAD